MTSLRAEMAGRVRDTVFRHIDGVAVGTTMAALESRGALARIARQRVTRFERLRDELGANPGFLHVAIRLLADQGWVTFDGGPDLGRLGIVPTDTGRAVFTRLASGYARAVEFLPAAMRIEDVLHGSYAVDVLRSYADLMQDEWGLSSVEAPERAKAQVLAHLDGHVLAPLVWALSRRHVSAEAATGAGPIGQAMHILESRGWASLADEPRLTAEGSMAMALAPQYQLPVVYLPLLSHAEQLILGDADSGRPALQEQESHLDRELDLRFSGEVFARTCLDPFLAAALPTFDRLPVDEQPVAIVDSGGGDGTVLMMLFEAVRASTLRGRHLAEHPLLLVGVDPSPVARRMMADRMSAAALPHLVLDGDIADPQRLRRDLAEHGVDARQALHICKSAIHDRDFMAPDGLVRPTVEPPPSSSAYATPDGASVSAHDAAVSLTDLLARWRPIVDLHGWLVIEAHATPCETTARLHGHSTGTILDASHGFSCQYPVEPEVFAWAARQAGLVPLHHAEPGADVLGYTPLTIDRFLVPAR